MTNRRHDHTRGIHNMGGDSDGDFPLLTHTFWGLLIFLAVIWLMFFSTFKFGSYPQQWIEALMGKFSFFLGQKMQDGWLLDFLQNGIINGIGAVLAFLPNILILFFFIFLLEETRYLPRAAKLMDKYMHRIGLHGCSFIPLLMGFGCNVPAIMATRSIKRRSDRILTMMMIPYIPCSARIPTFLLFSGIFFPKHSTLVMMLLYLGGILTGIVIALINKRIFFRGQSEDYETELPPLKVPNIRSALKGMWGAASEYLKKIGTVVLLAVVIVWALDYFPINEGVPEEEASPSYLHRFGQAVEPVMTPLGFDWKMSAALIAGITAKEFIISTLGVLYQESGEELDTTALSARIAADDSVNRANALSFMVFSLLYIPCVATATTIRRESGSWKWSLISIVTTLLVAWLFAFVAFRIGSILW